MLWMVQSGIRIWQTLLLAMIHQLFTQKTWPPFSKTLQNILSVFFRFCQASWSHGGEYGVFRPASHWCHKHRWDSPQENEYLLELAVSLNTWLTLHYQDFLPFHSIKCKLLAHPQSTNFSHEPKLIHGYNLFFLHMFQKHAIFVKLHGFYDLVGKD